MLLLVSAAAGWALLWATAQGSRHATERAADSAALAAAAAALHHLAAQTGQNPCTSAAQAAARAGARVVSCVCSPLDCTVQVERDVALLDVLAAGAPAFREQARSRAGPVGESG